ncbi:MAG: dTDP-4-amino-4,6-dideoxygalactose transaminase [Clostridiales bacterium]|nr:dTDP-4-amino-4,6-dideoxygalactose transaminase [Clostridiales bacterium]
MIPFNLTTVNEFDFEYLYKNIEFKEKLKEKFHREFNIKNSYFTTSCSSALDMAAEIIEINPGDEVILPSYTYVTTAMGFVKRGAKLIFADISEDNFVMDFEDVKRKITSKTKAIVPVHYAGISMDMDPLVELANSEKIYVIEDAAQGVDAQYKDSYLGTIGDMGTYSFHYTKNISCGEGGALLLNNSKLEDKANVVFEKGTDRHSFIKGITDKYSWVGLGGSYEMSEYLMAILLGQMDKKEMIMKERKRVYDYYQVLLDKEIQYKKPVIPEYSKSNYHIFPILLKSEEIRNEIIFKMKEEGIHTTFHYQPLHLSQFGKRKGYQQFELPMTEKISKQIIRLPIYPDLKDEQIEFISETLNKIILGGK